MKLYFFTGPAPAPPSGCTGALVSDFHVVTAAHCIIDGGPTSTEFRVLPGMDNGWALGPDFSKQPLEMSAFGAARLDGPPEVFPGWVDFDTTPALDIAILRLDRNIGSLTGVFPREVLADGDPAFAGTLAVGGYPSDLDGAANLYFDSDTGTDPSTGSPCPVYAARHRYNMDTAGGMSGAPVWRTVSGTATMISVHHGTFVPGADCGNVAVRLNAAKESWIADFLTNDVPPTDLGDIREYVGKGGTYLSPVQLYSDFSPDIIRPGATFDAKVRIRNAGTAPLGAFVNDFYASDNTIINPLDHKVATVTASAGMAPFSDRFLSHSGSFPFMPDGFYWIGWLLDANDDVAEFEDDDNIGYHRAKQLMVDGTPPEGTLRVALTALGHIQVDWEAWDHLSGLRPRLVIEEQGPIHPLVFLFGGGGGTPWHLACEHFVSGSFDSGACFRSPSAPGVYCYRISQIWDRADNMGSYPIGNDPPPCVFFSPWNALLDNAFPPGANEPPPECSDGIDNDGDGLADYPDDPSCTSYGQDDESEAPPECNDGADNDGDQTEDYPRDPGCSSPTDDSESTPQCADGFDNDGDGWVDEPDDTGCAGPTDDTEAEPVPTCNDGIDNDSDGAADYPADAGCAGPHSSE